MSFRVDNRVINEEISNIVNRIKLELNNGKLATVRVDGDDLVVSCPFHKNGKEKIPDCHIYIGEDTKELKQGTFHCFACQEKGSFAKFVGGCFDEDESFGKKWLLDKYSSLLTNYELKLDYINIEKQNKTFLDEKMLDKFEEWHPYLSKRKLSSNVCKLFKVRYDKDSRCIIFPVWDENNNLVMLTKRSIDTKFFSIPSNVNKPVYLLNSIIKNKIDTVIVVESQINALTCFSYGIPSIALFGTGSEYQYNILNKSGIRHYILMFDGDDAGDKAISRFKKSINKDVIIDVVKLPRGKDVNDLSIDEFFYLLRINNINYNNLLVSI